MYKQHLQLSAIYFYLIVFVNASGWMSCPELSPALRLPCKCQMDQTSVKGQPSSVAMDCDRIVFTSDTPQIPLGAPVTSFSQRNSGQQALPTQVCRSIFTAAINKFHERGSFVLDFGIICTSAHCHISCRLFPSLMEQSRCEEIFLGKRNFSIDDNDVDSVAIPIVSNYLLLPRRDSCEIEDILLI